MQLIPYKDTDSIIVGFLTLNYSISQYLFRFKYGKIGNFWGTCSVDGTEQ